MCLVRCYLSLRTPAPPPSQPRQSAAHSCPAGPTLSNNPSFLRKAARRQALSETGAWASSPPPGLMQGRLPALVPVLPGVEVPNPPGTQPASPLRPLLNPAEQAVNWTPGPGISPGAGRGGIVWGLSPDWLRPGPPLPFPPSPRPGRGAWRPRDQPGASMSRREGSLGKGLNVTVECPRGAVV